MLIYARVTVNTDSTHEMVLSMLKQKIGSGGGTRALLRYVFWVQSVFSIQNIQIRVKEINRHNFPPIKDTQIQVAVVHADTNLIQKSLCNVNCRLNDKPFTILRIYWIGVADVHGILIFTVVAVDTMVW